MDSTLTRYERETVVVFNEADPDAELYTCSAPMMRKMDKLVEEDDRFSVVKEDEVSKTYKFPKKYFKVRRPSKKEGLKPAFLDSGEEET
jgi:hypothetical protein